MADFEAHQLPREKRLFSFLTSKLVPPVPLPHERKPYPEGTTNFFNTLFFSWLIPIMKVGYKRTLQEEDLYYLTDSFKLVVMFDKFTKKLSLVRHHKMTERHKLLFAMFKTFGLEYSSALLLMIGAQVLSTLLPLLSKSLINFVEGRSLGTEKSVGKGIGYAFGVTILVLINGFLQNHSLQRAIMVGARSKSVLTKVIINKSFHLSEKSKHHYPSGKITSMLGADLSRFDLALGFFPVLFSFPFAFVISVVILIVNIGPSGLVGVALVFVFIYGLTHSLGKLLRLRKVVNKYTDQRVTHIQEVLNNMRMIKFYSWENPYYKAISDTRKHEMKNLLKIQTIRNSLMSVSMSFTSIASMVAFLVLFAVRKNSGPGPIFASLTLFNVLAQLVYVLPLVTSNCADAYVSLGRVATFLSCEEAEEDNAADYRVENNEVSESAVHIDHADFEWKSFDDSDENESRSYSYALRDIDLNIKNGEFVVLTGTIGSGKSSLLNAIAGFMPCKAGTTTVNGSFIFASQPWIQNASIRENILFGADYDKERYEKVISVCCLQMDLQNFSAGDHTEVGERGITLSGGQKARISFARAVYANADIILLDDVLSAVDAKVGKKIMNDCILGHLQNRTRILATHQLSLIGHADRVVFLNGDGTVDVGTMAELQQRNEKFQNLVQHNVLEAVNDTDDDDEYEEKMAIDTKEESDSESESEKGSGKLMIQEVRATNSLKLAVYTNYLRFGSGRLKPVGFLILFVSSMTLSIFCMLFANAWLAFWIDDKFSNRSSGFYIGIYVMLSVLGVLFLVVALLSLAIMSNNASKNLLIKSVENVLHTPMSYLDTTPLGRIMNRFSRDTEVLDNELTNQLRISTFTLAMIIGIIILCIIYLPWFAIAVPFLGLAFIMICNFYQTTSREVKRLDSTQRSFVYSTFGEILSGMETFKIYHVEKDFVNKLDELIDKMNEAYFITITSQRWLGLNLNIVSTFFALLIALLSVNTVFNISASSVGLLLSYVLQFTLQLTQLMRSITQVENQMNSVERLCEYSLDLEQEAPYVISDTTPPPSWPEEGSVKFEGVSMAYRPGLPMVLKDLNFEIRPHEKIGICGRTGAGKSSIMTAIFRLAELLKGNITIDGIDIGTLGLNALRSKLSIIPQDPVLFEGTIRRNLDPFNQLDEDTMLEALRKVNLVSAQEIEGFTSGELTKEDNKFHLDHFVENDGSNYSLGEKQLISFARALIRSSKVLILDEATSSVDYKTDNLVQKTIAEDFQHCTILCIAHRLRTILNYDRIMVLEKGQVIEVDTPKNLFARENSVFRDMCNKSEITEADFR